MIPFAMGNAGQGREDAQGGEGMQEDVGGGTTEGEGVTASIGARQRSTRQGRIFFLLGMGASRLERGVRRTVMTSAFFGRRARAAKEGCDTDG